MIELAHLTEAQKRAYVIADNQTRPARGLGRGAAGARAGRAQGTRLRSGADRLLAGGARRLAGRRRAKAWSTTMPHPSSRASRSPARAICGGWARTGCCAAMRRWRPTSTGCSTASGLAMVFTDPPYNVDYGNRAKDKLRGKSRKILNDDLGAGFGAFLRGGLPQPAAGQRGRGLRLHVAAPSCTRCSGPSPAPAGTGARSSSGPRTRSPWAGPITNGSSSRSSMAGPKGRSATGAGRATRAMSGTATSRCGTTCTRP